MTYRISSFATASLVLLSLSAGPCIAAPDVDIRGLIEARDFLEAYRIADAGEARLSDLYSDRATVHVRIQGQPQGFDFRGRAYKDWSQALSSRGEAILQRSVFQAASVERHGDRLLIRARRYSASQCYWDNEYRVTIEKEGLQTRIVDERLTLQTSPHCQRSLKTVPASGDGRGLDLAINTPAPSSPAVPVWHPLSHEEIAAMALRMARASAASTAPPPPLGGTSAEPPAAASTHPSLPKSALRVDPVDAE